MKRFVLLFLFTALMLLCSCGRGFSGTTVVEENKNPVNTDTDGYILYVVNTKSYTYHYTNCYVLESTSDENKALTYDLDFLVNHAYSPCKICIK